MKIFRIIAGTIIFGFIIAGGVYYTQNINTSHRYVVQVTYCDHRVPIIDTIDCYGKSLPTISTYRQSVPVVVDARGNTLYVNVCQFNIIQQLK